MRNALTTQAPGPAPDLCEHLAGLRLDPRSAGPAGWRVDWDDGPWPITVRTGGTRLGLRSAPDDPLLDRVTWLLRRTFAIGRVRADPRGGLPATPDSPFPRRHGSPVAARRPIPSGGAMYPVEAYLLLTGPGRLFHHDPYRHELVDLGRPDPVTAVRAALGDTAAPAVLVLTLRYWKNAYKYGEFAFRLGTVDAGVALGRALRIGTAAFGNARVRTDASDAELGQCLGLDPADEGPCAVMELGTGAGPTWTRSVWDPTAPVPAAPVIVERSRRVRRLPRLAAAHAAARSPGPFATAVCPDDPIAASGPAIPLPAPGPIDLPDPDPLGRRTSNGRLFRPAPVAAAAVSTVLAGTAAAVRAVHDAAGGVLGGDVVLLCAAQRVGGVPSGWYRYRPAGGQLIPVGAGADPGVGPALQDAMFADPVNLELAAFTVHVGAGTQPWWYGRGVRGYREQQLAVGAAVEALTLFATVVGLGSHPVLGFDVCPIEGRYGLSGSGTGVHAQVSIGPVGQDLDREIAVLPL
jgi:SagB-type dehydrogenase family enzyme